MIGLLDRPDSGRYVLGPEDVTSLSDRNRPMFVVIISALFFRFFILCRE